MTEEKNNVPEGCTHDCSSCGENCPSKNNPESLLAPSNPDSRVKNVIGVVSGKGGVGKSLVTSMLSVLTSRRGYKTAIMDTDITGPSIPQIFGMHSAEITGDDTGMNPPQTKSGIKLMSVNLLLEDETTPVVWRGPVIAGTVKQFWTDIHWGDVDYMYVDHASRNRRCAAYGIPVASPHRNRHRNKSSGACIHDSLKGNKNGADDEYSRSRNR